MHQSSCHYLRGAQGLCLSCCDGSNRTEESEGGGYLWLWPLSDWWWYLDTRTTQGCTKCTISVAFSQGTAFWDSHQEHQELVAVCEKCFKRGGRVYSKYLCCSFKGRPGQSKVGHTVFYTVFHNNTVYNHHFPVWGSPGRSSVFHMFFPFSKKLQKSMNYSGLFCYFL